MLSRVAERIYWLARYLERVEDTTRLIQVHSALLLDLPADAEINWFTLVRIFDAEPAFHAEFDEVSETNIMRFLISSESHSYSLRQSIAAVRENARTSLDILPEETWEQINQLHLLMKNSQKAMSNRHQRQTLLEEIITHCYGIRGIIQSQMNRTHAFYFLQLGRSLEQADMTSRILEMTSLLLSESRSETVRQHEGLLWTNLLQALSAHQMFLQTVGTQASAENVLGFMVLDRDFPGSLYFLLDTLSAHLTALPQRHSLMASVHRIIQEINHINFNQIPADQTHAVMDNLQGELDDLHSQISAKWFQPTTDKNTRPLVSKRLPHMSQSQTTVNTDVLTSNEEA